MSPWNKAHVEGALSLAGLEKGKDGRWGDPASRNPSWGLRTHPAGFISFSRPFSLPGRQEALAVHGSWEGPVKLARCGDEVEQRLDCFISPGLGDDPVLDSGASGKLESVAAEVVKLLARDDFEGHASMWQPPDSEKLLSWLSEAGYAAVCDDQNHLRMTLNRSGCPGRIRVIRESGCLRLVMPLGQWKKLAPAARKSLLLLAHRENSMNRLARIVWQGKGKGCSIEAQVDLTGLPVGNDLSESFLKDMLAMAVAGLDLVLRQMGLEVSVLAATQNRKLADQVLALSDHTQNLKPSEKPSTLVAAQKPKGALKQ